MFLHFQVIFRNLGTMPFDKIPKTRRTKKVAKDANLDGVDSIEFQGSSNIARHGEDLGVPEFDGLSEDSVDSAMVVSRVRKSEENILRRKFEDTPVGNEDLSQKCVEKQTDDVSYPEQGYETKAEEQAYSYTYCEMFWSLVAIVSYVIDIGSDVFVAYMYFGKEWYWFGLTVGFILTSSITITVVSLTWYRQDQQLSGNKEPETSRAEWICRVFLHILQLGPVVR